jgi:RNA-binding protein
MPAKAANKRRSPSRPAKQTETNPGLSSSPAAPDLSERQRKHLRGLAHDLKPVIRLGGSGLTDAVALETARALHDHELIKVKAPGGDREARDAAFAELANRTSSALIYRIGNVAVLYRPRADLPRILIPDA